MSYFAIFILVSFILTSIALWLLVKHDAPRTVWTQACLGIWIFDMTVVILAGFYWLLCRIVAVNAFSFSFGG